MDSTNHVLENPPNHPHGPAEPIPQTSGNKTGKSRKVMVAATPKVAHAMSSIENASNVKDCCAAVGNLITVCLQQTNNVEATVNQVKSAYSAVCKFCPKEESKSVAVSATMSAEVLGLLVVPIVNMLMGEARTARVGMTLLTIIAMLNTAFDVLTDSLLIAHYYITGNNSGFIATGSIVLCSNLVQAAVAVVGGQGLRDVLVALIGLKPLLEARRSIVGGVSKTKSSYPNAIVMAFSWVVEALIQSLPQSVVQTVIMLTTAPGNRTTLQYVGLFSSLATTTFCSGSR